MDSESTLKVEMPAAEPNGFVKTFNNMGYMTSTLDPVSKSFIDFSITTILPALDIGAAYGIASSKILRNRKTVFANDIDSRHLDVYENSLQPELRPYLKKTPGDFLSIELPKNSFDSVLICRVLHFFNGEKIEVAANRAFDWLSAKGRVFIVCETPYLLNFKNFIPVYEERKRAGEKWPGFIDDVMKYAPERGAFLPKEMHLLDPEVLVRVFENAGFKTLSCATMARTDFPVDLQLDGRESVGYIGEKP